MQENARHMPKVPNRGDLRKPRKQFEQTRLLRHRHDVENSKLVLGCMSGSFESLPW